MQLMEHFGITQTDMIDDETTLPLPKSGYRDDDYRHDNDLCPAEAYLTDQDTYRIEQLRPGRNGCGANDRGSFNIFHVFVGSSEQNKILKNARNTFTFQSNRWIFPS